MYTISNEQKIPSLPTLSQHTGKKLAVFSLCLLCFELKHVCNNIFIHMYAYIYFLPRPLWNSKAPPYGKTVISQNELAVVD